MTRRAAGAPATVAAPHLLFLVFAGVGVATIALPQPGRLAILYVALGVLVLAYPGLGSLEWRFSLPAVGRGALLGLVISLPVWAFVPTQLRAMAGRLYGAGDLALLFYQACLVPAPLEEVFFRGILAPEAGAAAGVGLYALAGLLYFAPHAPFPSVVAAVLAMALLGLVWTYVRESHGLAAATACHLVAAFVLLVWPALLAALRALLG
ncbi:MAG: CPBP family intramembrane metalloprotease [Chloroflexi bacterium]|nr:CPBP family intramembrane metalloprotease [Chloroflexota bacterium]